MRPYDTTLLTFSAVMLEVMSCAAECDLKLPQAAYFTLTSVSK